jgi:hypothetical protein
MLKTKLINTKVMRYKEHINKNVNPPPAMLNVPRSSGQLEPLVRPHIIEHNKFAGY